jgi:hypothetical protein
LNLQQVNARSKTGKIYFGNRSLMITTENPSLQIQQNSMGNADPIFGLEI